MNDADLTSRGTVALGTPITTEQATRAVLRLLKTPIIGDIDKDAGPGHTLARFHKDDGAIYSHLSRGEQALVDVAEGLWSGSDDRGARINVLGRLDAGHRRHIVIILAYRYLGRDLSMLEVPEVHWQRLFGDRASG